MIAEKRGSPSQACCRSTARSPKLHSTSYRKLEVILCCVKPYLKREETKPEKTWRVVLNPAFPLPSGMGTGDFRKEEGGTPVGLIKAGMTGTRGEHHRPTVSPAWGWTTCSRIPCEGKEQRAVGTLGRALTEPLHLGHLP